jgi:hypothetical protein
MKKPKKGMVGDEVFHKLSPAIQETLDKVAALAAVARDLREQRDRLRGIRPVMLFCRLWGAASGQWLYVPISPRSADGGIVVPDRSLLTLDQAVKRSGKSRSVLQWTWFNWARVTTSDADVDEIIKREFPEKLAEDRAAARRARRAARARHRELDAIHNKPRKTRVKPVRK